jgi:uncharacterized integral membrane protein
VLFTRARSDGDGKRENMKENQDTKWVEGYVVGINRESRTWRMTVVMMLLLLLLLLLLPS